jgi:Xaa-Pro aminopeptidase
MSHAPTDILDRRLQTVRTGMAAQALDALVVTSLANVLYLTNFYGSSAIAIVTAERVLFITDSRYFTTMSDIQGSPELPGPRDDRVRRLWRRNAGVRWPRSRTGGWGLKPRIFRSAAIRG